MALTLSTLAKPVNPQVIDPSTGVMRPEWLDYFGRLTSQLNAATGELTTDKAPANAEYLVGSASSGLTAERVATNSTSNSWNLTVAGQAAVERAALTGDVTASANSNATTIANDAVTNAKLANMADSTLKGRAAGAGTGDPTDLTASQALTLLGAFAGIAVQVLTTGTTSYTPTTGMKSCLVISTGAGGGGGGADCADTNAVAVGGGGGAGATCIEAFTAATIGASQTVSIGTAGTAGSDTGGNGGAGGNTTFGTGPLHTAGGGSGGTGISTGTSDIGAGGAGGTATGGAMNITGGGGGVGLPDNTINQGTAGDGGGSFWGGGPVGQARATTGGSTAGANGVAYGSGGTGAVSVDTTTGAAGGTGAPGVIFVLEFL